MPARLPNDSHSYEMPPPSYPAQISAAVDRSSSPSLSARAALDAYAANPHLRSSPTFEFLHFAVVNKYDVCFEEEGNGSAWDSDSESSIDRKEFVSLLGLDGPVGDPWWLEEVTGCEPWQVIDVDLEDATGARCASSARP